MRSYIFLLLIFIYTRFGLFAQEPFFSDNSYYPYIDTDTVQDYYYGKFILDPFRILEDIGNEQVTLWMDKQNILYDSIIHAINSYDSLRNEIQKLEDSQYKWTAGPRIIGNRFYYVYGLYSEPDIQRLGYSDGYNEETIEIFSTKELNEKDSCYYYFDYFEPSFDGNYIAFGLSTGGTEIATIYVLDITKRELLSEKIEFSIAGNIQWLNDNSGFFYMRDKEILTEDDKNTFREDARTMLHKLYEEPKNDREIVSRLLNKNLDIEKKNRPCLFLFPSSDKVLLNILKGSFYEVYYAYLKDVLGKPGDSVKWEQIANTEDRMSSNALYGNRFFGLSFENNPNGQLIVMELPDTTKKVVFEATDFVLDDLALTQKNLYVSILKNGYNKLVEINPQNLNITHIELPILGGLNLSTYFSLVTSYQSSSSLFFSMQGYGKQIVGYIVDESHKVKRTSIFSEGLVTDHSITLIEEEIEVPSYDGAMVPLSIIYKANLELNGNNPLIINAYGAYGTSLRPVFNRNRLVWFNKGGIYAVAHVRGGSEKGDNWYKGGFKATKPNSWKDLIACAEYLIENKYTSSEKIAAMGYSAGGITIGRAITERPDLFKAAVIFVGDLNTLRMENSFNPQVNEFGTVKDSLEFQYLYEMDTYHHIYPGVNYPSVLFATSMNDSRVAPWQTMKAAAKMQQVSNGNNVVLLYLGNWGHFDYPPDADVYSFLFWQLGHPDFKLKSCPFSDN